MRWLFFGLLAASIFPPFIPLLGPLSADDVFGVLAVGGGLIGLSVFSRSRPHIDLTQPTIILFAAIAIITNSFAAESMGELLRMDAKSGGRLLFYAALVLCVKALAKEEDAAKSALYLFASAATLEALFCLWAFLTVYVGPYGLGVIGFADWSVLAGKLRVQGTFSGALQGHEVAAVSANFLAAYLVMSVPVTTALALSQTVRRRLAIGLGAAALQVVTLYLTYTRAAIIALGAGILAFGWFLNHKRLAAGVLVAGLAASMAVPAVRNKFLNEGHDRWALYWASAQILRDHPITGVGAGHYEEVLHTTQSYHDTPFGQAATTSHNSILLAAADHGAAGGIALGLVYLALLTSLLQAASRARSPSSRLQIAGIGAALVGFLVQDQFNNLAFVPKVVTQMWFLFGLLFAFTSGARASLEEPDPPVGAGSSSPA